MKTDSVITIFYLDDTGTVQQTAHPCLTSIRKSAAADFSGGIAEKRSVSVRIFGSADTKIGDRAVLGIFTGDDIPETALTVTEIYDNSRGHLPHTKVVLS